MTYDDMDEAVRLIQVAANLIADDLVNATEDDAPEHFRFLSRASEFLQRNTVSQESA